jgi:hypothetical protein
MLLDKIKILFKRRRDNKSRYSANKIYISRAELKHTNTKIIILLFSYNKQKSTLLRCIRKIMFFIRLYKILDELKDKYVVKHKNIFTRFFKSMIYPFRIITRIIKVGKKEKKVRYIPDQANRLNHLLKKNFFLFKK